MALKNIYALLIGINEYGQAPLNGCLNDINRIAQYLNTLPNDHYAVDIAFLRNADATKAGIIDGINTQFGKAQAGDIALMYFSGHGVQEYAPAWLQPYEHDNKIECIVCYDRGQEQFLLADKEMRYIFSSDAIDPGVQLITIFDCCHSGDNTRAIGDVHVARRLARNFPSRQYDQFIFSDTFDHTDLEQHLNDRIPVRHQIHISACRAYEQAYEDKDLHRGIFTNFLCTLLDTRASQVRYIDIKQIAKMQFTAARDKQIPEIAIRGEGTASLYDGWLGHSLDSTALTLRADHIPVQGWMINAGQMHGLEEGDEVTLVVPGDTPVKTRISEIMADKARLFVLNDADVARLQEDRSYQVDIGLKHRATLQFAVHDLDGNDGLSTTLVKYLKDAGRLSADSPNFDIIIFNDFVYITDPSNRFRPRAEQLPVRSTADVDAIDLSQLGYQIEALEKAYAVAHLSNPATVLYRDAPVTVRMAIMGSADYTQVTNGVFEAAVDPNNYRAELQIEIENTSEHLVFVSAAIISQLCGVYTHILLPESSLKLEPGEVYQAHKEKRQVVALEPYRRFYNWADEEIEYKIVVSSHEPVELSSFNQGELDPPILSGFRTTAAKGIVDVTREERNPDWGTVDITLRLLNPDYNNAGILSEEDLSDDMFAPFAIQNFYEFDQQGLAFAAKAKDAGSAEKAKGFVLDVGLPIANRVAHMMRNRRYKRLRKKYPTYPVIFSEGDSWFQHPLLTDIIDQVMHLCPVRSLGAAGDTMRNMMHTGELRKALDAARAANELPLCVLVSGGGNDILGKDILKFLVHADEAPPGGGAERFLNADFQKEIDDIMGMYDTLVSGYPEVAFLCHGYDHMTPLEVGNKKGWVGKYLTEKKILDINDRRGVTEYMVNMFNDQMTALAAGKDNMTFIDNRSTLRSDQWDDEIHPNNPGFQIVSLAFQNEIVEMIQALPPAEGQA